MNEKFDSNFNVPKIDDVETGGALNTFCVLDCLEPLRKQLALYHISAMWYAANGKFTVYAKYTDNPDLGSSYDNADYDLGDMNAVGDLARFVDRLKCMYAIKNNEKRIADEHNLIDPVYTLPTIKDKGKVVFTDGATGERVKFTFARLDLNKLLNSAPKQ